MESPEDSIKKHSVAKTTVQYSSSRSHVADSSMSLFKLIRSAIEDESITKVGASEEQKTISAIGEMNINLKKIVDLYLLGKSHRINRMATA